MRNILVLGLLLVAGSVFVAVDANNRAAKDPSYTFDVVAYASEAPARLQTYVKDDLGPKIKAGTEIAQDKVEAWMKAEPGEPSVPGEATGTTEGLDDPDTPAEGDGIKISDLTEMTVAEIYENRVAIVKGLTQSAKEKLQTVFN